MRLTDILWKTLCSWSKFRIRIRIKDKIKCEISFSFILPTIHWNWSTTVSCTIASNSLHCFLVRSIFINMNYDFFRFIASWFYFSSLQVHMNHVQLFLLLLDGFCQVLTFFFVLNNILFMLFDAIFILSNGKTMFVLKDLYLFD